MGKRKERRLAALSAAGRRVKLDLFSEPSGDLDGSPVHDEDGEDLNHNDRAGLPISPSSSGKQQENPLLLLGQYSDEELDEEVDRKHKNDVLNDFLGDCDDQVEESATVKYGDPEGDTGKDLDALLVKQEESEGDSASLDGVKHQDVTDIGEIDATASGKPSSDVESLEQTSVPETSGMEVIGDVTAGWKMVMHEESNQCYYWNTLTGETSWEVPDGMVKGPELTSEELVPPVTKDIKCALAGGHVSGQNLEGELDNALAVTHVNGSNNINFISIIKENHEHRVPLEKQTEEYEGKSQEDQNLGCDTDQTELKDSSGSVRALCHGDSLVCCSPHSSEQLKEILLGVEDTTIAGYEGKDKNQVTDNECHEEGDVPSFRLIKYGETLLERLKALKGSKDHEKGHEWMEKYILEVEIRLSDFKSLLAYGSSLHPFWTHSEGQLKRLECAINDEVSQFANSEQMDEADAVNLSSYKGNNISSNTSSQSIKGEFEADQEKKMAISAPENHHAYSPNSDFNNAALVFSSGSPTRHLDSVVERSTEEICEIAPTAELISKSGPLVVEDVDMDVDMEVDDSTLEINTAVDSFSSEYFAPPEHIIQPNLTPVECSSLTFGDEFSVPPPPDEDWIPPPPPENEPVPPPPPDEPPSQSYPPPPPYSETIQLLPYSEQYNLAYPVSNFDYYGHMVTDVPSTNYYPHPDVCHITEIQPPVYYGALPNTYPDAPSSVVNLVEPVVYYDLPNGTVPHGSVTSSLEYSGLQTESGPLSYNDAVVSEQIGPVEVFAGSGCSSLSSIQVESDVSAPGHETEVETMRAAITSATIKATATVSVNESAPAPSTAGFATAAPLASAARAESKVLRSKKRTIAVAPTLRSNKKVSTLVDKWKAAKEELQEDEEDEPENPYEMLEKKRQREIEEWRAKQIASGEARDNANFQPLGGDWRERVKRKRAQTARAYVNAKQQPDLVELSRDLPSGWQAYWDESSKEVYYGNAVTSETTWAKPTK